MRARATIMGIVLAGYRPVVQPWQHRWGATDEEVGRAMPGDVVVPATRS